MNSEKNREKILNMFKKYEHELLTKNMIREELNINYNTVKKVVHELNQKGIILSITDGKNNKYYTLRKKQEEKGE